MKQHGLCHISYHICLWNLVRQPGIFVLFSQENMWFCMMSYTPKQIWCSNVSFNRNFFYNAWLSVINIAVIIINLHNTSWQIARLEDSFTTKWNISKLWPLFLSYMLAAQFLFHFLDKSRSFEIASSLGIIRKLILKCGYPFSRCSSWAANPSMKTAKLRTHLWLVCFSFFFCLVFKGVFDIHLMASSRCHTIVCRHRGGAQG